MDFHIYPKIENDVRSLDITETYIATEKVHGCNFSIYYDGKDFKFGRRKDFIKEKEIFYSYENIVKKYESDIKNIYSKLKLKYLDEFDYIIIYGELFGGHWISNNDKIKSSIVQKGIYYCDINEFIIFDICLVDDTSNNFLPYNILKDVINNEDGKLKLVPIICKDKIDNLIKIDWNNYNSVIPKLFGLENLKDNTIEGIVIRIEDKNSKYLKIKTEKFNEIKNKNKNKKKRIVDYITKSRYDSVKSKFLEKSSKEELFEEFINDVIIDYENDTNKKVSIPKNLLKYIRSQFDLFNL
jgi:Rnl2 family RNA ligase